MIDRSCDFYIEDLEDAIRDSKNSFLINNKRVWMDRKPDFLQKLDQKLRRENDIPETKKCVTSVFLPNGEVWPIDCSVKKDQFDTSILIPTDDTRDLVNKTSLSRMRSYVIYPDDQILNLNVRGCLIMFDYVKDEWVKQKQDEKQKMKEQLESALEALS